MAQAKAGDTVKVHYTGRFEDGTVFDTSIERDPLQFKIGDGRMIPGFEQAVVGMNPGESQTTKVLASEAYGQYHEEMVLTVERDQLPADMELTVDQQLQIPQEDGRIVIVTVTAVSESSVTLDGNHPLAGQDLTFDIQLIEIA